MAITESTKRFLGRTLRDCSATRGMKDVDAVSPGRWACAVRLGAVAEAECEADVAATLRRLTYSLSGDGKGGVATVLQPGSGILYNTEDPIAMPEWVALDDLDCRVSEFSRTGFRGGLNGYRVLRFGTELMAPWYGAPIRQPSLFMFFAGSSMLSKWDVGGPRQTRRTHVPGEERPATRSRKTAVPRRPTFLGNPLGNSRPSDWRSLCPEEKHFESVPDPIALRRHNQPNLNISLRRRVFALCPEWK